MFVKRLWLLGIGLGLLIVLAACQGEDENAGGGIGTPAAQNEAAATVTADEAETEVAEDALTEVESTAESDPEPTAAEPTVEKAATEEVADPTPENEDAAETPEADSLPTLPLIVNVTVPGGGAPDLDFQAASTDDPAVSELSIAPLDFFSGTNFVLDVELPAEPTTATAVQQPARNLTVERARTIAEGFGFSGPLYQEAQPTFEVQPADATTPFAPALPYYAINADEFLSITANGAFYEDRAVAPSYPSLIAFEEAEQVATAFLQERGLLNFEYAAVSGFGGEVQYKRVIDGHEVNLPELFVFVNDAGQVVFATYDWLPDLEAVGPYPLVPAADAWERIQGGIFNNGIPYEFLPTAENETIIEFNGAEAFQSWMRAYEPGDELFLYTTPTVYLPVEAEVPPVIRLFDYTLTGEADVLGAIADQTVEGAPTLMIQGVLGEDGETVTLADWEPVPEYQPLFLEGAVQLADAGAVFTTVDGDEYLLPDPPEGLSDGMEVFVFAWAARDVGEAYQLLEWQNIDRKVANDLPVEGEPIVSEPLLGPVQYSTMTIDQVELAYYYAATPEYTEDGYPVNDAPAVTLQPVWKFSGTAESETATERVALYVQAAEGAYIETP